MNKLRTGSEILFLGIFFITKKKDSFFTTWKKSPHCQEIVQKREALCVCAPQLSSDGLGFFCSTYYPNLGKLKTSFFLFFWWFFKVLQGSIESSLLIIKILITNTGHFSNPSLCPAAVVLESYKIWDTICIRIVLNKVLLM